MKFEIATKFTRALVAIRPALLLRTHVSGYTLYVVKTEMASS